MAEIGLKRKATRSLVADTKRMRIEVSGEHMANIICCLD